MQNRSKAVLSASRIVANLHGLPEELLFACLHSPLCDPGHLASLLQRSLDPRSATPAEGDGVRTRFSVITGITSVRITRTRLSAIDLFPCPPRPDSHRASLPQYQPAPRSERPNPLFPSPTKPLRPLALVRFPGIPRDCMLVRWDTRPFPSRTNGLRQNDRGRHTPRPDQTGSHTALAETPSLP